MGYINEYNMGGNIWVYHFDILEFPPQHPEGNSSKKKVYYLDWRGNSSAPTLLYVLLQITM